MKTAIYARVSTTDQTNVIQVRELKEYVERRGWELAGVYQDQISGATPSRMNGKICLSKMLSVRTSTSSALSNP